MKKNKETPKKAGAKGWGERERKKKREEQSKAVKRTNCVIKYLNLEKVWNGCKLKCAFFGREMFFNKMHSWRSVFLEDKQTKTKRKNN